MRYFSTAVAHAMATAVILSISVLLTVLSYFGLLAWAALANAPIGGPLALPFMILVAFVGSCMAVLVVLFPSTLLSEITCRKLHWPKLIEIPLATLASLLISLIVGSTVGWFYGDIEQALRLALISELVLLVPLGAYWWSVQGTSGLIKLGARVWRYFRGAA